MALPLKEIPSYVREHTHLVLTRIADNRSMNLNALVREVLEQYVEKQIHDAKVVLGQDSDNQNQPDLPGFELEESRVARRARK